MAVPCGPNFLGRTEEVPEVSSIAIPVYYYFLAPFDAGLTGTAD
jgi:hypothetical protein